MDLINLVFGAIAGVSILAALIAVLMVARVASRAQAAEIWQGEAEAWQARAERLADELAQIKDRLTALEEENRRLVAVISRLSPDNGTP
ncbi:hypothetical protein [Yinghuangia sp. YIM S09857]|uniref:hypothetical protein n=1 Tax=Yinghuangia sp. YIM S09857 TaxID=3436929 RepID=UPI003F53DE8B